MHLDKFEDTIHALILEQGKVYHENGAVLDLEETIEGWKSTVKGQEIYHVLIIGREEIMDWNCDCPYDHGPVCKHVTATLFALRASLENRNPALQRALHLLRTAPADLLVEYMQKKIRRDADFMEDFLHAFAEEE